MLERKKEKNEREREREGERSAFRTVKKHIHTDIHQFGIALIFLSFFCSRVYSLPQLALLPLKKKK